MSLRILAAIENKPYISEQHQHAPIDGRPLFPCKR